VAIRRSRSRNFNRQKATRPPHNRVLIVCEGSKTEPNYFDDIRIKSRLSQTHVRIINGQGTQPIQVVDTALATFAKSREYEIVYAVFDRDDHTTYHDAVARAEANRKKLKNNDRKTVLFEAVVSVPCFEVWLLMHFQDVTAWEHRDIIISKLQTHVPSYSKGRKGMYSLTASGIPLATQRAIAERAKNGRLPGNSIYTDVDSVVTTLHKLID
jgi:RloB-like protein